MYNTFTPAVFFGYVDIKSLVCNKSILLNVSNRLWWIPSTVCYCVVIVVSSSSSSNVSSNNFIGTLGHPSLLWGLSSGRHCHSYIRAGHTYRNHLSYDVPGSSLANMCKLGSQKQKTTWTTLRAPHRAQQVGLFSGSLQSPLHGSVIDAWGFFMAADSAAHLPWPRFGRCWSMTAYSSGKAPAFFAGNPQGHATIHHL